MTQQCQLQTGGLIWQSKRTLAIKDLSGAILKKSDQACRLQGRGVPGYRVILTTATTQIPLSSIETCEDTPHREIVNQINGFVRDPQQRSLQVQQDNRMRTWIIGGILIAIGVFLPKNVF